MTRASETPAAVLQFKVMLELRKVVQCIALMLEMGNSTVAFNVERPELLAVKVCLVDVFEPEIP